MKVLFVEPPNEQCARFYGSWRKRLKISFSSNNLKRRVHWYMANGSLMTQLEALF